VAKENKFGTFGGVFTPSLLTILGVIMYLRLPWVVGHAGLYGVLGIILVAHIISVATGLSISSIATDKNVGAGGPYYIVSRSMGLPIGGALGMALFIGLCFSTSLYVIGLSESVLSTLGIEATPTAIRISGTIALVLITAITVISTSLAIKTQYIVLVLILASLGAIFLGDSEGLPTPKGPIEKTPSMALLFGIFFPAVTGFTAGVNMSGDLKDPKSAIPRGTMAAIFTGLFVYVGLAIFLHQNVPTDVLISDPNALADFSLSGAAVIAGIWGATLSSGLGSIMGAPRILQALSSDRITPALFAKGTGPTQEPRNALVLAFLIAEAGILIAELNAIARIVSMVFLTMYGFLNLTCAIEAKVSPDFRPAFRIPSLVSVIGAVTCLVIMIQLDLIAMLGAVALMVGLFIYLQRKQLKLESGDAWEGIWSTMIRSGLYRITGTEEKQQRNWRPNILAFRESSASAESDAAYDEFAQALITGNGILTDFEMNRGAQHKGARPSVPEGSIRPEKPDEPKSEVDELKESQAEKKSKKKKKKDRKKKKAVDERAIGMFRRTLAVDGSPFEEIRTVCQHYGFSGLEPNALLLPFRLHESDPDAFSATIDHAADQDFNVLVYKHGESKAPVDKKKGPRIDIWWRVDEGNIAFCMTLLKFITRAPSWENASVRFLLLSTDTANNDNLRSTMRRLLRESRVEGTVKIVSDTFGDRSFVDRVRTLSEDAALTIAGLPNESDELDTASLEEFSELCRSLGRVLFVRGSSVFGEVLPTGRGAAVSELPPLPEDGVGIAQLPELTLSDIPDIQTATTEYSEAYQRLVGRFSDQCLKKVYGRHVELIRSIRKAATRHLEADKALKAGNPRRQRTAFNRQQSSFLLECKTQLEAFTNDELPDLRSILDGGLDTYLHDDGVVSPEDKILLVSRKKDDFQPHADDSAYVRRFKRRRRLVAAFSRRDPQYKIPISQLQRHYFQTGIRDLLAPALRGFVTESHQLLVQLGKVLNSSRAHVPEDGEEIELAEIISAQRAQICDHLDELDRQGKELLRRRRWTLIVDALTLTQKYADDLERLDIHPLIAKSRQVTESFDTEDLEEIPALWKKHQAQLTVRAILALSLSGVQHRLTAIVGRERDAIKLGLKNGAASECQRVSAKLTPLLDALKEGTASFEDLNLHVDSKTIFDPGPTIDNLVRECGGSSDELPTTLATLTDESIQALEEGRLDSVEQVELPVKRLMQFLVETELIGGLQEALRVVPKSEQRALGVAQDVVRLVNFQLSELDSADEISPEELKNQLSPVIENSIERLDGEYEALSTLSRGLLAEVDQRLHVVVDGTNAYELSSSTGRLDQHIRVHQGKRAVSGARGFLRKGIKRVRNTVVELMYRRSEGVLLARRRTAALRGSENSVDRIATMVRGQVPRAEVVDALPFYYRQLFFGQSGVNETFWVGRKDEVQKARQALREFDRGQPGSLLIVGDRLAGKSALVQKLSSDVLSSRKIYRVHAPPGGSVDPQVFARAVTKAIGGDLSESPSGAASALSSVPAGSVVVLDDLNLWWERSGDGLRVIQQVLSAIQSHGHRILFLITLETQAFRLINRLVPLSDSSLALLECGPLPADSLKSIVTLRHNSTGLKYRLGKKGEDELGAIALARLFSQHFDHTGGSVGATLRAWVSSIDKVRGEMLEISVPHRKDWESLDTLKSSWVAILLQLALHKQMSIERLRRVSGLSRQELKEELSALRRMGLVIETQRRILEIEPSIYPALQERFSKRGVFS